MRQTAPFPRPSIFDAMQARASEVARDDGSGTETATPASAFRLARRPPMLGRPWRGNKTWFLAMIAVLFGCAGLGLVWMPRPAAPPPPAEALAAAKTVTEPRLAPSAELDTAEPEAAVQRAALEGPRVEPSQRRSEVSPLALDEPRPVPLPSAEPREVVRPPATAAASPAPAAASPPPPASSPRALEAGEAQEAAAPRAVEPESPKTPAVKVFAPSPDYPSGARQRGLAGTVVVQAEIDTEGAVSAARVLRGAAPELDQAAVDAVRTWRFDPARRGDEAVTDTYRVAIRFTPRPAETTAAPPPAAPAAAAAPAAPAALADFEPPVKLYTPPPRYPQGDWMAAIEGDVVLRAAIDEQGSVTGIEVLEGLSPSLDQAAVQALEQWRFRPARRQGEPIAAHQVLRFRFAR